ncbi:MAG: hypothetical protein ACE5HM_07470 [Acidiferrobacterales bacterium]
MLKLAFERDVQWLPGNTAKLETMTMSEIVIDRKGAIATVILNNPDKRNGH